MFDLPASQVTPEILHSLYEQKLDELRGNVTLDFAPAQASVPAAMHCR
jgi:hypothetical protein